MNNEYLKNDERISIELRNLYRNYGYSQYKVRKFEEYDLYMRYKSFLLSEQVLTFNDPNGKLMALKPDITLSIIKNTSHKCKTNKLCYTERVYRVPSGGSDFREILQTGLECIGHIDDYSMCEVLMLAAKSLETISSSYVLDISDMSIILGILDEENIESDSRSQFFSSFREKNLCALKNACLSFGISKNNEEILSKLISMYCPLEDALDILESYSLPQKSVDAVQGLRRICNTLSDYGQQNIFLDFSVVNDTDYYNGLIFKGYIDGVPASVLSGGRYDGLVAQLGKNSGAIGFAVYLDELERFNEEKPEYDVDTLIIYDMSTPSSLIARTAMEQRIMGKSVRVNFENADNIKSRNTIFLDGRNNI